MLFPLYCHIFQFSFLDGPSLNISFFASSVTYTNFMIDKRSWLIPSRKVPPAHPDATMKAHQDHLDRLELQHTHHQFPSPLLDLPLALPFPPLLLSARLEATNNLAHQDFAQDSLKLSPLVLNTPPLRIAAILLLLRIFRTSTMPATVLLARTNLAAFVLVASARQFNKLLLKTFYRQWKIPLLLVFAMTR